MPSRTNPGTADRGAPARGVTSVLSGPSASVTGRHFAFDCGETVGSAWAARDGGWRQMAASSHTVSSTPFSRRPRGVKRRQELLEATLRVLAREGSAAHDNARGRRRGRRAAHRDDLLLRFKAGAASGGVAIARRARGGTGVGGHGRNRVGSVIGRHQRGACAVRARRPWTWPRPAPGGDQAAA